MILRAKIRMRVRKIKIALNLGVGRIAPLTHMVPKRPRRAIRDWVIKVTTPRDRIRRYRAPVRDGKISAPMGINEYGMLRADNGLAQGAKLYARALISSGIPYTLINMDFLEFLPQVDRRLDQYISRKGKYAVNLIHINADQIEKACYDFPHRLFDDHYNIGVWLWELEKIPDSWIEKMDYFDEIWTPSCFVSNAVRKATDKPVVTIPYGIETPTENIGRKEFGFRESEFLVLAMYDSNSYVTRKNPNGAVDAFLKAFGNGEKDAALVLKVSNGYPEELEALKKRLESSGIRYYLITERLSKPRLNALIACCDVFISMHRSEGFGLVIAEAMSLRVPVVATGWSSNVEFMPAECTCRVGYRMVPVGDAYQYKEETQMWADPDTDEAAEYLKMLKADPGKANKMAEEAQKYIQQEYSIQACGEKMAKRYAEIQAELKAKGLF